MEKEQTLKSLLAKKRLFLILGIVLMCIYIVPIIASGVIGGMYGYELVQDGYSVQYILSHMSEIMLAMYRNYPWLLVLDMIGTALLYTGIVFLILSLAVFGRKAKNLKREIAKEKELIEEK